MSNTQSHLIVKEEGIHYFLMPEEPNVPRDLALLDYQMHNIRSDYDRWQEYDKAVQQAQSSAILCEDQERATELIIKLHYPDLVPVADRLDLEIGSIYPVPGIEFEETAIGQDCKHKYDPIPATCGTVNNCDCPYVTVARLIEHTAEKGDVYTIYKNGQLMKPDPNFNPINIRCSPEIDKEEEQDSMWKREYDDAVREICDLQAQLKEAESYIRTLEAELRER